MINNRADLKEYLVADYNALGYSYRRVLPLFGMETVKFQKAMRMLEYYTNKNLPCYILNYMFWRYRYHKLSIKLGFDIPINTFGKGLNIHHFGCVVVNGLAKIGTNCSIQQGVVIGFDGKNLEAAPRIGNNVTIGAGAKVIGNINIPNNTIIGANAVVTKSFYEEGLTLKGVPAKPI